jgi:hypothetical protein
MGVTLEPETFLFVTTCERPQAQPLKELTPVNNFGWV